jgi:primosomal protein N'
MKKETAVDENGEVVEVAKGNALVDGQIIEIYAATQEDIDQVTALIGSIDKVLAYDREIMGIISEESQAYFNGQKSAKDTATIMQQRVSTYVNEQR